MTVTPEELAAFADGELEPARSAEVAAAIEADPALAERVREHRALKQRLSAHFAPIMDEPLPHTLTALLRPREDADVISFAAAREKRTRTAPRWTWFAGPALAASLALAVLLPRSDDDGYAEGALAEVLEGQLVASQDAASPTRILLSFRDRAGAYCRAFAGEARSGIACRDGDGWKLQMQGTGPTGEGGEYRMAGASVAQVMERAQAMAAGPALDASQEAAARTKGWR